jgi:hypothetical protein
MARPEVLVEDLVELLKDRLLGEPFVDEAERVPTETLLQVPLASQVAPTIEPRLRLLCGAYVASPQFLLGGWTPIDSTEVPALVAAEDGYPAACEDARGRFQTIGAPFAVDCADPVRVVIR